MTGLNQFARFSAIGAFATGLQYVILVALVEVAHTDAVIASAVGFAISALANYWLNRRFTFQSSQAHIAAMPRFAGVAASGLALNTFLVWLFHSGLALHYVPAQLLATAATLAWTFTLNRTWTFQSTSVSPMPGKESL